MKKRNLLTSTIFFTLAATHAYGTTWTWNGVTNNTWNVVTNWTPNGTPVNGDTLIFPTGAAQQSNNDNLNPALSSLATIQFQNTGSGSAAYSLTGGGVTGLTITTSFIVDANIGTQSVSILTILPNNTTIP